MNFWPWSTHTPRKRPDHWEAEIRAVVEPKMRELAEELIAQILRDADKLYQQETSDTFSGYSFAVHANPIAHVWKKYP